MSDEEQGTDHGRPTQREQLILCTVDEVQLRKGQRDPVAVTLRDLVFEHHGGTA